MINSEERTELVKFRATKTLRQALKLRAAYDDLDMSEVILEALDVHLKPELDDLKQRTPVSTTPKKL